MPCLDYDLTLTDEQRAIRDSAHRFAAEVMRPAGIELDRLSPEEVVAPGSRLYDVVRQARDLGFMSLAGPAEVGGLGASPRTQHLVLEELAWGSLGLTAVMFLSEWPPLAALGSGNPALAEEFAGPYYGKAGGVRLGAWAITEPNHGSDTLGAMRPEMAVAGPGDLVARRDGDHWVLSGQKSAWVSNGPIANQAVVNVNVDPKGRLDRGGVCILPLDLPGISRGRPLNKHGLRSLPQGEIFFDEVRIPRRYMMAEDAAYPRHVNSTLTAFNAGVGAITAGLARAAYETALAYTKERIQGGRPIFEHQAVRARLFRMFSLVQATRAFSREVFVYNQTQLATGGPAPIEHSIASKVFCTDAALEVATLAVQLHGGNGMTKEYPAEMFLRDATALTIADGENAFLSQLGAAEL
ncbi:MAG: acyl-CoA/acyl-ACP dehydrogenase [Deltaproteobacteria bacterium]|nr:acyl-CoA/acyl-ACP dehydrogenase [Deltaproteobacteria bacterium]